MRSEVRALILHASNFKTFLSAFSITPLGMSKKAVVSKESNRHLSPKEATLFRELLSLYETKNLKKGLKTADQILKKYPEHGGAFRIHLISWILF
jgi:hypothetical protein